MHLLTFMLSEWNLHLITPYSCTFMTFPTKSFWNHLLITPAHKAFPTECHLNPNFPFQNSKKFFNVKILWLRSPHFKSAKQKPHNIFIVCFYTHTSFIYLLFSYFFLVPCNTYKELDLKSFQVLTHHYLTWTVFSRSPKSVCRQIS